jgi:hypothetical protein
MKQILLTFLVFSLCLFHGLAQQFGMDYRTTLDTTNRLHYLRFNSNGTLVIKFFGFPSNLMFPPNEVSCYYYKKGDTISISPKDSNKILADKEVIYRLINSRIIVRSMDELFDINSGYTYLSNSYVRKNHMDKDNSCLIILDEKQYMFRKRGNFLFRSKLRRLDSHDLQTIIIKGPEAYNIYGIKGINGVLLIKEK